MGKVSKPLTIVVFPPLDTWPEIEKLEKQGHNVVYPNHKREGMKPEDGDYLLARIADADIILGPQCWMMTGLHRKHLQAAIKQSRLRKYGIIAKKTKEEVNDEEVDNSSAPESTD